MKSSKGVVEGVATLQVVIELVHKYNLDMPLTKAIHELLTGHIKVEDMQAKLMSLELRKDLPSIERDHL
jgi:glycerol-3-phosphate dehydrogenase